MVDRTLEDLVHFMPPHDVVNSFGHGNYNWGTMCYEMDTHYIRWGVTCGPTLEMIKAREVRNRTLRALIEMGNNG